MKTSTILLIVLVLALVAVIAVTLTLGFVLAPSPAVSAVSPPPDNIPTPPPLHFVSPYVPIFTGSPGAAPPSTIYKLDAKNRICAPIFTSLSAVYFIGGTLTVDQDYALVAATKSVQYVNFRLGGLIANSFPLVSGTNITSIDVNLLGTVALITQNENSNVYYRMPIANLAPESLTYPSVGRIWYGTLSKTADVAYLLTYDTIAPPLRVGVVNTFSTTPTAVSASLPISLNLLDRVCEFCRTPMVMSANSHRVFLAVEDAANNFGVVTVDLTVSPPAIIPGNSWDLTGLVGGSTVVTGFGVSSDGVYAYFVTGVTSQCVGVDLQTGVVTLFGLGLIINPVALLVANKTIFVLDLENGMLPNQAQLLMWDITTPGVTYTPLTPQLFPENVRPESFGINSDVAAGLIA